MVQEGEGKERKLGRHTAHVEGLGDVHKWHGKGSSSVCLRPPLYRDPPTDPPTVSFILKLPPSSSTFFFLQQL